MHISVFFGIVDHPKVNPSGVSNFGYNVSIAKSTYVFDPYIKVSGALLKNQAHNALSYALDSAFFFNVSDTNFFVMSQPLSNTSSELRTDGRVNNALRPVQIICHTNRYAEGSCMFQMGHTHVMCTASVEDNKVPSHVKEGGWLTAEYAMLPRSTHYRSQRDRTPAAPNSRGREIQRLIGRSLRAMVDLSQIGKRTIVIDCDVLQADGGTRCAAINGGAIALRLALQRLVREEKVLSLPVLHSVAAVSVCCQNNRLMIDPDYEEDSQCDMDLNLIGNQAGDLIEIQGSAEGHPIVLPTMINMIHEGLAAQQKLLGMMDDALTHQPRFC